MDREENELKLRATPRRTFFTTAAAGFTSLFAGAAGLSGCNRSVEGLDDSDSADLGSLRAVDPKLVKYHETLKIETSFSEARNIVIAPDQAVWAVGDNRLVRFESGKASAPITVDGEPMCMALAPDGTIYVGFADHVEALDRDGRRKSGWPTLNADGAVQPQWTFVQSGHDQQDTNYAAGLQVTAPIFDEIGRAHV